MTVYAARQSEIFSIALKIDFLPYGPSRQTMPCCHLLFAAQLKIKSSAPPIQNYIYLLKDK